MLSMFTRRRLMIGFTSRSFRCLRLETSDAPFSIAMDSGALPVLPEPKAEKRNSLRSSGFLPELRDRKKILARVALQKETNMLGFQWDNVRLSFYLFRRISCDVQWLSNLNRDINDAVYKKRTEAKLQLIMEGMVALAAQMSSGQDVSSNFSKLKIQVQDDAAQIDEHVPVINPSLPNSCNHTTRPGARTTVAHPTASTALSSIEHLVTVAEQAAETNDVAAALKALDAGQVILKDTCQPIELDTNVESLVIDDEALSKTRTRMIAELLDGYDAISIESCREVARKFAYIIGKYLSELSQ